MEDFINIILPGNTSGEDIAEIQKSVKEIDTVDSVEQISTRTLDAESVMLWVQAAGSILTIAGTAVTLIKKVIDIIRKKNLTNVKIKLPKDIEISIDNTSVEEIQRILESMTKK